MDVYKEFNHQLKFFMRELMKLFPSMTELKFMFVLYKCMKTINRKKPQQYFHSLMSENSKQLLSKDINYFFSKDCVDENLMKIIPSLKKGYVLLDDENKEMIWKNLVFLYHLSLKCQEKIDIKDNSIHNLKDGLQIENPRDPRKVTTEVTGG